MRDYIFGYNQGILLKKELNLQDILILKYLEDFFSSGNAKKIKINNQDFYLVYYNKILKDLPILNIGYDMLRKKIKRLEDKGLLIKYKQEINSTTLYLQLNLDLLNAKVSYQEYEGKDTILKTFVRTNWKIKKNFKCGFKIFSNVFYYEHSIIKPHLVNSFLDSFKDNLFKYLEMVLPPLTYSKFEQQLDFKVVNNKLQFSTINYANLQDDFVDNLDKIEMAICQTFLNLIKNF